jgi:sugar transferase (PEP-CTERM/EpsH1 system associated)
MRQAITQCVSKAPPDVVVAYCTGMARYALEPPLDRVPWILDMVDVDSEKWAALAETARPPMQWVYAREATLLRAFERRAMIAASATTVVSERERDLLMRLASAPPVAVVPNGVDVTAFAPQGPPTCEPRVVFCGVFNYGPNETGARWMASDVWPLVTRAEPAARLSLVGMDPSRSVRALADDPSIDVTGTVPDVREYLWRAAVSVAPLSIARGIQNKVLESLAAGLPCVVTPQVLQGLPTGVRAGCSTAADARAFADAILALLRQEPAERRRIARLADVASLQWSVQLQPILALTAAAFKSR